MMMQKKDRDGGRNGIVKTEGLSEEARTVGGKAEEPDWVKRHVKELLTEKRLDRIWERLQPPQKPGGIARKI